VFPVDAFEVFCPSCITTASPFPFLWVSLMAAGAVFSIDIFTTAVGPAFIFYALSFSFDFTSFVSCDFNDRVKFGSTTSTG
jgi:hypothetical protein